MFSLLRQLGFERFSNGDQLPLMPLHGFELAVFLAPQLLRVDGAAVNAERHPHQNKSQQQRTALRLDQPAQPERLFGR
jgi:hypothetical protein